MMDVTSIGAALALVNGKLTGVDAATSAANTAAQQANTAAQAATGAAAQATQAASGWVGLSEQEMHSRIAADLAYTILQAQMRSVQDDIATLKAQINALST